MRRLFAVLSGAYKRDQMAQLVSVIRDGSDAREEYLLLANDDSLRVGVDGVNGMAHWAFDVHEEGVWRLDLSLEFMLGGLISGVHVKKIDFHVSSQKRKC